MQIWFHALLENTTVPDLQQPILKVGIKKRPFFALGPKSQNGPKIHLMPTKQLKNGIMFIWENGTFFPTTFHAGGRNMVRRRK